MKETNNCGFCIAALVVVFTAGAVSGSEWNTASGQHCIDACRYSGSENLYHWCRTADRDDRRRWDYCTPTRFFHFNDTELVWVEIEGNVTELGSVRTALYPQTECIGDCLPPDDERLNLKMCETEADNPFAVVDEASGKKSFYCADENVKPKREQLSSVDGLWCVDDCAKEGDFHRCNTLTGKDYCSPQRDTTTKGKECTHPCQYNSDGIKDEEADKTAGVYFCFTSADNFTRAGCGYYPKEDRSTLERLEFAVVGTAGTAKTLLSICADQCHPEYEDDPYEHCTVLLWKPYPSGNGYRLVQELAYCHGKAPPIPPISVGTIIGISIFAVAIGLVCSCVVYSSVRKQLQPG